MIAAGRKESGERSMKPKNLECKTEKERQEDLGN